MAFLGHMSTDALVAARIVTAAAGETVGAVADTHLFVIHVGPPVHARCRLGSLAAERVQRRGDIDIVPAGDQGVWVDDRPAEVLALRFDPAAFGSGVAPRIGVRDPGLAPLIAAFEALLADAATDRFRLAGLGAAFAARAGARFGATTGRAVPPLLDRRLRAVAAYVEERLDRPIDVAELAAVAGLRPSQFTAAFRSATGQSPYGFVTRARVARARALIQAGAMPLAEVALACGFSHQSHLTRRLKEHLGVTPGALRAGR
jgi:AraC family transcriptional regulator